MRGNFAIMWTKRSWMGMESEGSKSERIKPDSVKLDVVIRKRIRQKVLKLGRRLGILLAKM